MTQTCPRCYKADDVLFDARGERFYCDKCSYAWRAVSAESYDDRRLKWPMADEVKPGLWVARTSHSIFAKRERDVHGVPIEE